MLVNVGFMEPTAFLIGVVFLWRFGLVVVCGVVLCFVKYSMIVDKDVRVVVGWR